MRLTNYTSKPCAALVSHPIRELVYRADKARFGRLDTFALTTEPGFYHAYEVITRTNSPVDPDRNRGMVEIYKTLNQTPYEYEIVKTLVDPHGNGARITYIYYVSTMTRTVDPEDTPYALAPFPDGTERIIDLTATRAVAQPRRSLLQRLLRVA